MGASNNSGMTSNMFTVVHGRWTKRVEEGTVGAIERTLEKGKNAGSRVYELGYTTLSGHLIGGELEKSDFGWSGKITLHDRNDGQDYLISLPIDSKFLMDIAKRLTVINPEEELVLMLAQSKKKFTKAGSPVFNLYIRQGAKLLEDQYVEWKTGGDGKKLPSYKNGVPPPEPDPITGSLDWKAHDRFLLGKFKEFFEKFEPAIPYVPMSEAPEVEEPESHEEDFDVPF